MIKREEASEKYQDLFSTYTKSLHQACEEAANWWENTIIALRERSKCTHDEAIEESFNRRLAGAASHPKVVSVVRTFWLRCQDLNKANGSDCVYPKVLLLKWLVDSGEKELTKLVACMPYWPMGLNDLGEWC